MAPNFPANFDKIYCWQPFNHLAQLIELTEFLFSVNSKAVDLLLLIHCVLLLPLCNSIYSHMGHLQLM